MNDFGDLDELERELGPALRLALRRAADQITDDPQGRDSLMSYLQTSPDEQIAPHPSPGGGRRRLVVVVAAIAAVAAIIIAAILLASRDDESAPVDQPTDVTTGESVPTTVVAPAGGVQPPYVLDLGTGERTPLPETIADPSVVSYVPSPDGTQLAFYTCCSGDDVMTIANPDGSSAQEVAPSPGLNAYGPAWSPDGTKLVYQERDGNGDQLGTLVVVDLATGERTQVVDFGDSSSGWWFTSPRFSADGEHVLYHYKTGGAAITSDVYSVPVTGGEPTMVVENASYPVPVGTAARSPSSRRRPRTWGVTASRSPAPTERARRAPWSRRRTSYSGPRCHRTGPGSPTRTAVRCGWSTSRPVSPRRWPTAGTPSTGSTTTRSSSRSPSDASAADHHQHLDPRR